MDDNENGLRWLERKIGSWEILPHLPWFAAYKLCLVVKLYRARTLIVCFIKNYIYNLMTEITKEKGQNLLVTDVEGKQKE